MPDQPSPNRPIIGFVVGKPILTVLCKKVVQRKLGNLWDLGSDRQAGIVLAKEQSEQKGEHPGL